MQNKLNKNKILKLIILLIIIEFIVFMILNLIKPKENTIEESGLKLEEKYIRNNEYTYNQFNKMINNLFEYILEKDSEALMAILDNKLIEEKSLNSQNIMQYFNDYLDASRYNSLEVYSQKIGDIQIYKGEYSCIKGTITKAGKEENIFFFIREDYINSTFSISIINEEEYEKIKKSKNISDDLEINIEPNNYNKINF